MCFEIYLFFVFLSYYISLLLFNYEYDELNFVRFIYFFNVIMFDVVDFIYRF